MSEVFLPNMLRTAVLTLLSLRDGKTPGVLSPRAGIASTIDAPADAGPPQKKIIGGC